MASIQCYLARGVVKGLQPDKTGPASDEVSEVSTLSSIRLTHDSTPYTSRISRMTATGENVCPQRYITVGGSKPGENTQRHQFLNLRILTSSERGDPCRLAAASSSSQDHNAQCTIATLFKPVQLFSSIKHLLSWRVGTSFEHYSLNLKRQMNFLKCAKVLASHANSIHELVMVIWTLNLDSCFLNKEKKRGEGGEKSPVLHLSL